MLIKSSICRLITVVSVLLACTLFSSVHARDVTHSVISRLSIQEGLTQGEVTTTLIDSDGFLWIGTAEGLNRFDGYEVKTINGPNNILRFAFINSLLQDTNGDLWISSTPGGLMRLDLSENKYEQIFEPKRDTLFDFHQDFSSINQDSQGIIWITHGHKLLKYNPETKVLSEPYSFTSYLQPEQAITAATSIDKYVAIGTENGLFIIDTQNGQLKRLDLSQKAQGSQSVTSFFTDSEGHIWLSSRDGLHAFDPKEIPEFFAKHQQINITSWILDVPVYAIAEQNRSIIIGTEAGLYGLQSRQGELALLLRFSDSIFQLSDNTVRYITPDKFGNYWLASVTEGAYLWSPKTDAFDTVYLTDNLMQTSRPIGYRQRSNLPNQIIWSFYQSAPETLWVGSNNGINEFNLTTKQQTAFLKQTQNEELTVSQILDAGNGRLWLATSNGLKRFNTRVKEEELIELADESQRDLLLSVAWALYPYTENELWFMSDKGMFIYNTRTKIITKNERLAHHLPLNFLSIILGNIPDEPHKLVIGTEGHAWIYDTETDTSQAIISPKITGTLPHSSPTAMHVDYEQNTLWIAFATSGLYGLDLKSYQLKKHYNEANGLTSDTIFSLLPDEEGNIWISSHSGLMKLHKSSGFIQSFSIQDGLLTPEFNEGASIKLQDGRLAFGSIKGFTLLSPSYFSNQENTPFSVYITDVGLMSRPLFNTLGHHNNSSIELDHDDIGLSINFSTLFLSHQHQTYYDYALIGDETLDYPRNKDNSLTIPQLAPGNYVFEVQALSPFSGNYSDKAQLFIKVNHAPWSSPLAVSGYIILCLMLFTVWIHRRNIQQKGLLAAHNELKESEERLQLALRCNRSGVWEWDANTNLIYEPRIRDDLQRVDFRKNIPYEGHLSLIHPKDKPLFVRHWHNLLSGANDHLDCNYRLMDKDGNWLWYRDVGKVVVRSTNNSPLKISGTYTNITDAEVNRTEALLFGEAFQKTRDGVIILDENRTPIAANESFYQLTQVKPEQLQLNLWDALRWSQSKRAHYVNIVEKLKENEHWQGEEVFHTQHNVTIPVFIKISTFRTPNASRFNYVVVITDITRQKDAETKLKRLANYDPLTQLPNRNLLSDRIKHAIDRARRSEETIAVFFLDLDRFKQVNDSLGHDAGDKLLATVAERLISTLRTDDTVARLGGDEFVILLESYRSIEHISAIAKKVINTIDQPMMLNGQVVSVSTSIGVAIYPTDATNTTDLLKHADLAMYHAKESGRNNFQFFAESMNQKAKLRLVKESQLKQALINKEFVNFYQPIVDAKTSKVVGFELLLRWMSKDGMVSPMEFIPLAEEIGLITRMTVEAMHTALKDLSHWHMTNPNLYISINLSPRHIDEPQIIEDIDKALASSSISVKHLRFEITESALMRDKDKALSVLNDLKDKGCTLALDDFGTGYSSLLYLKMFPIDIIKIDRSFVMDIGIDNNDEALISTIIGMADALGKFCIAEGVETEEQAVFLNKLGCEYFQGYLYGKPASADTIKEVIDVVDLS